MDLGLADDSVIVFGGAHGIGFAIAAGFAAEGANIGLIDRDPDVVAAASALASDHGIRAAARIVDVTNEQAIEETKSFLLDDLGKLDHVVYAVGVGSGRIGFPFWTMGASEWRRVLDVNLVGAAIVAGAFAPMLVDQGAGTFLFLASIAGQTGSQTDPPYSAAKAGLINFAQCAARDLAPHGVRVNAICPGSVRTRLHRTIWEAWRDRQPPDQLRSYDDWSAERLSQVPLGRWQEPADIANLAVFLASPRAHNITGQTMNVDGGMVMRG